MRLNARKNKTMSVSKLHKTYSYSPPHLTLGGTVLKESVDSDIFLCDTKETHFFMFSQQLRKGCILRKSWSAFHVSRFFCDALGVMPCQFWSTILRCGDRL